MTRDVLLEALAEKMASDKSADIANGAFLIIMKTLHSILDAQDENEIRLITLKDSIEQKINDFKVSSEQKINDLKISAEQKIADTEAKVVIIDTKLTTDLIEALDEIKTNQEKKIQHWERTILIFSISYGVLTAASTILGVISFFK